MFPNQSSLYPECIRQNLHTMRSLACAMGWAGTNSPLTTLGLHRYWAVGQWCDCLDTVEQWLEGRVLAVNAEAGLVLIHYNGWPARWDEWLPASSPRLAPFRTHTRHLTLPWASSPLPVCMNTDSPSMGPPPPLLSSAGTPIPLSSTIPSPVVHKLDVHLPYPHHRSVHVKVTLGEEDVRSIIPGVIEWGKVLGHMLERLERLACEQPRREARRAALMGGAGTEAVYHRGWQS